MISWLQRMRIDRDNRDNRNRDELADLESMLRLERQRSQRLVETLNVISAEKNRLAKILASDFASEMRRHMAGEMARVATQKIWEQVFTPEDDTLEPIKIPRRYLRMMNPDDTVTHVVEHWLQQIPGKLRAFSPDEPAELHVVRLRYEVPSLGIEQFITKENLER